MSKTYHVNLVVEVTCTDVSAHAAADHAETTIQRLLDTHAKRLHAVVGADYGDVTRVDGISPVSNAIVVAASRSRV